ncbi:MAG: pilus assembly protein PilM [Oscillospiraceae bacterium]|jgi:type IV pilus assembly protein PilM|nr:pilus assembly protein PilM [Oscillospiraceae bacterium]
MISIDITDTQIKLLEATVAAKISVKKAIMRDLPVGCIENGRILDMHIVAGEITDILVTEKISDREAIMCINSGMILYKEIEIPKPKSGSENFVVESIIQNEMSLGDEYNITYSISEEIVTDEGPKLKVIAAACPQNMIDIYLELSRQIGLKTKLVMVSNTCITRLVRKSSVYKNFSPLLLLQIDKNFISINLYNKGAVVFSRHTKIDASDYENSPDYINLAVFDNLFRTMHLLDQNELSGEIKEIQYFGAIKDEKALHATIKQLNLEAREFEYPSDIVKSKRNYNFIEFANVIGSLIKVDVKTENINLLNTKEKRIKTLNMRFSLVALLFAAVCAVIVLGVWATLTFITGGKERTLENLESEFLTLRYSETLASVNEKEDAIQKFGNYSDAVDTAKVLFDFQPKMTRNIAERLVAVMEPFDGLEIFGPFTVTGYTTTVNFICTDDAHPAAFTEALIENGYFQNITFYGYTRVSIEETEDEFLLFTLGMRVKGGNILEP